MDHPIRGGTYTRDPVTGALTPDVAEAAQDALEADLVPVEADTGPADPAPQPTSKKGGK